MDNLSGFGWLLVSIVAPLLKGVYLGECFAIEPTRKNGGIQYPPNERKSKGTGYVTPKGGDELTPSERREADAQVWGRRLAALEAFLSPSIEVGQDGVERMIHHPNEIKEISPFTEGVGLVLPGEIGPSYNPDVGFGARVYSEYKHSPHSDGQRIVKGLSAGQT